MSTETLYRFRCDAPHCTTAVLAEDLKDVPEGWRVLKSTDHIPVPPPQPAYARRKPRILFLRHEVRPMQHRVEDRRRRWTRTGFPYGECMVAAPSDRAPVVRGARRLLTHLARPSPHGGRALLCPCGAPRPSGPGHRRCVSLHQP